MRTTNMIGAIVKRQRLDCIGDIGLRNTFLILNTRPTWTASYVFVDALDFKGKVVELLIASCFEKDENYEIVEF